MSSNSKFAAWTLALVIFATLPLQAQQRQGGGSPRGMMRGIAGVEQILVFLAYDKQMKVSDNQWVELREALRESHAKQRAMQNRMRQAWSLSRIPSQMQDDEGGREAMRKAMTEMREEMTQATKEMQEKVTALLDEDQVKLFEKHLTEMQERRGRRR